MCGIVAIVAPVPPDPLPATLRQRLQCRGPDFAGHASAVISAADGVGCHISCHASVLSLRGDVVEAQPLSSGSLQLLCWNGEAWRFQGHDLPAGQCDTSLVWGKLTEASKEDCDSAAAVADAAVLRTLYAIEGPFAIFFVDGLNKRIYLGRDRLGRRSLVWKEDERGLVVASVGDGSPGWQEVAAGTLVALDFAARTSNDDGSAAGLFAQFTSAFKVKAHQISYPSLDFNKTLPDSDAQYLTITSQPVQYLQKLLCQSLVPRITTLPSYTTTSQLSRFAVLFSGGLDCTTLARLMHDLVPPDEPIDLLNVAFENPRIIKSSSATPKQKGGSASKSDEALQENSSQTQSPFDLCPDRQTAQSAVAELRQACPGRRFTLVKVNISYQEFLAHRPTIIDLMAPHATEMDLSIAAALYFAARGRGIVSGAQTYTTPARILVSGLGADELFAGYQRHATAFSRGGHVALVAELELDYRRLGQRNLGRDDRVMSHWGKEVRFPFLDERLVQWAVGAPVQEKCGFGVVAPAGDEDDIEDGKRVLRLVAKNLGLEGVSKEKKRAIQFGARSAKMESGKSRGTDAL